jgi:hypothetical protein
MARQRAFACCLCLLPGFLIGDISSASAQENTSQPGAAASAEASAALKRVQDYLRGAPELRFVTQIAVHSSLGGGTTQATADFITRKPNLFRVEFAIKGRRYLVLSDGKLITIFRPAANSYAQYPTSDTLIGTMYTVVGLSNLSGRMLDFFWAAGATHDVTVSAIPAIQVGGRQCTGIRVTRFEETFDVWLEQKGQQLPCRLQSRRTDSLATLVHTYVFAWKDPSASAAETFSFIPPKGSRRVDAVELR